MNRSASAVLLAVQLAAPVAAQTLDRSRPVPPLPLKPFDMPAIREKSLESGLKLAVVSAARLPLVSARIVVPVGGSAFDPKGKEGLADIVASVMREGTLRRSGVEFTEAVEEAGAVIEADSSVDYFVVTVFAAKEKLKEAFGLAVEMIRSPAFPESDLARVKQEMKLEMEDQKSNPGAAAAKRFSARVFGDHPYAREADEASVDSISRSDLQAFQRERLGPERAVVAAAGDITLEELEGLVRPAFESWKSAAAKAAPPAAFADPRTVVASADGLVIDLIDQPGSIQTTIKMGHMMIPRNHPDYAKIYVMNTILGGGPFFSRLGSVLREEKGWTYGVRSNISSMKLGGAFSVDTSVQIDASAPAVAEIIRQIRRMQDEPVTAEELGIAKRFRATTYIMNSEKVQGLAAEAASAEVYGLGPDEIKTWRDKLNAVTAQDVQAAAREYLRPDDIVIVVAGDAGKIYHELSAVQGVSAVRVFDSDGNPQPRPTARF